VITVKGQKALREADVVLYDALSNPALLAEVPANCLKIYVGKRANRHRYSQEEINLLIVQYAFSHGHVVRLKGGDPFIFGRGHEELEYISAFNIETAIIPGISSCYAVPEMQQVPLTRRGVNESFWVLTGTTSNGEISSDLKLAAQSSATIVILMGIRKLPEITRLFSRYGKSNTPAMVIQNGTLPNERKAIGTVSTIEAAVRAENIGSPGIILIGEVVDLHPDRMEEFESILNHYS
jgi:uroporphyrin-III C-methyltransferase